MATGILLLTASLLGGCIDIHVAPRQQPVVVVPSQTTEDGVVLAEIDSVFSLSFESSQVDRLSPILRRPNLSPAVQTYVAARIARDLSFESNQVTLLKLLIQNPVFSNTAKQQILSDLQKLSFDSNKKAILSALEQRGPLSS